jgi:polyisoprenoid-binding protein YceI
MNIHHLIKAALLTTAFGMTALAASQNYVVSKNVPALAEFKFSVTLIPIPGTVKSVSADLNFDPKNLTKTSGKISVDLSKLETGIGLRDEHARGYLGVEKHRDAVFSLNRIEGIKALEKGKESKGIAVGNFDLNGIKTPLNAPITLNFDGKLVNVHTEFEVTLADHKIDIPGADSKVGVKVNFALEAKAN